MFHIACKRNIGRCLRGLIEIKIGGVKIDYGLNIYRNNYNYKLKVPFDVYIKDIGKAYKNLESIRRQFIIDSPRTYIYLNNYRVKDSEIINNFLNSRYNDIQKRNIMLLFTQSLMAPVFKMIHNSIIDKQLYLAEPSVKKRTNYEIKLKLDDNIILNAKKKFRIFKLDKKYSPNNLYDVIITIEINLKKSNDVNINIDYIKL